MDRVLGWFFRLFNKAFERAANDYTLAVGGTLRRAGIALIVYAGLLLLPWGGFNIVPAGFIPTQDQG
jgi:multidrug efflux pump subunit AcrB